MFARRDAMRDGLALVGRISPVATWSIWSFAVWKAWACDRRCRRLQRSPQRAW